MQMKPDTENCDTENCVEAFFAVRRDAFPPRRVDGARKIPGVRWGRLMAMRDLRG